MPALLLNSISALLAFSGLLYEFVFAQSLSIWLGNSAKQYAWTIGIFLAAMGVAAQISERVQKIDRALLWTQGTLAFFIPVLYLGLWRIFPFVSSTTMAALAIFTVVLIGFLTGFELPLLLRWPNAPEGLHLLAADYLGMLLAALVFPLVLLPYFGVVATLLLAALGNSLALSFLCRRRLKVVWLWPFVLVFLFFHEEGIRTWLAQIYLGRAL
jgi:spermidine synthase